ncbi:glycosyltransferase family 2 protein [Celerinatantimonas diazotrophica]|uniref:(Heptosyl)LPS beta-1,4-glucosyltransferase n=1 Tax=Celerinatantimonas diazotrophica TaxID=412034 RepID=A0A4V6NE16_9GAMM|nr:glycosyltransferase family 2 protein [Celerinatantimonas diazotrophica]TCK46368.1 (heptosyl)LPS beta-1,4-glucosyltransferase [Celerinatantimonas diazotrophica]CAG9295258.1 hypothetical protein CEDIAZO_00370 [Celerinatantimonas diazotrophica]
MTNSLKNHTSRATLGVAMITKNAAADLETCLSRLESIYDQLVIVDSGSSDETETIARRYTHEFYTHDDWPGFGKQRQRAQQYLTTDWVLFIDADEFVTDQLKQSIIQVLTENPADSCYKINRLSIAFGKAIRHSGWNPDWVTRLYRREQTHYNDALVHEHLVIPKHIKVKPLAGRMEHLTCRNITQYVQKTQGYMKAWADQREGKKKASLGSAISHSLFRFIRMYILKLGFLDGRHGLLISILSAYTVFVRYSDLWLRQSATRKEDNDL